MALTRLPGSFLFGPQVVWTKGSTSVSLYHYVSEPVESASLVKVRVSVEMGQETGNMKLRLIVRASDDGISWDAPVTLDATWRTNDGTWPGTTWTDITSLAGLTQRPYFQFGVECLNESGTLIELANATVRVEVQRT